MGLFFGLLMVGQPENGDWGFQAAFSLWSFRRHWRPSEMLKRQAVNQATACVRTAHTLHVGFEVPRNSQVGCVAQPRTRLLEYAGYGLLFKRHNNLFIICIFIIILVFIIFR